jgi:hypothetical protein
MSSCTNSLDGHVQIALIQSYLLFCIVDFDLLALRCMPREQGRWQDRIRRYRGRRRRDARRHITRAAFALSPRARARLKAIARVDPRRWR